MKKKRSFGLFPLAAIAILGGACSKAEPPAPAALEAPGEGRTDAPPVVSECPASDTRPTVMIRDCDTGVANVAVGACTAADQFPACLDGPADDLPRCIAKVSNRLMEMGAIDGPDKGRIQRCAAADEGAASE